GSTDGGQPIVAGQWRPYFGHGIGKQKDVLRAKRAYDHFIYAVGEEHDPVRRTQRIDSHRIVTHTPIDRNRVEVQTGFREVAHALDHIDAVYATVSAARRCHAERVDIDFFDVVELGDHQSIACDNDL